MICLYCLKLTKDEPDELRNHNAKENTRFEPLEFKLGALGGASEEQIEHSTHYFVILASHLNSKYLKSIYLKMFCVTNYF